MGLGKTSGDKNDMNSDARATNRQAGRPLIDRSGIRTKSSLTIQIADHTTTPATLGWTRLGLDIDDDAVARLAQIDDSEVLEIEQVSCVLHVPGSADTALAHSIGLIRSLSARGRNPSQCCRD